MDGAEATLVAVLCAIGRPDLSTKITPAAIAGLQSRGVAGAGVTCRNPFEHDAADRIIVPCSGRFELAWGQRERT
jgi:hypothetical protein